MSNHVCIIRQRDYYELPVRREAETLRDAGFEVDVICLQQEGHPNVEIDNGITLYRLPVRRRKGNFVRYLYDYFVFFLLASLKLTYLHLKHRYQVIQVNTMPDFLVFCTLIPRLLGAKVIAFMKEPTPELGETLYGPKLMPKILKVVEQGALKYANLSFTVTEQLKATYVRRGARADKIRVILNGPDDKHLLQHRPSLSSPDPDAFTLICHGAVEERYGHDTILKGVQLAKQQVPNLRLRLLGTGSFAPHVQQMISELGLEAYVDYLGWVSMSTLVAELCRADVGLVAQKSSPYSNLVHTNKMYEYIIFGKPVIASCLDAIAAYFDDSSIRYFEPGNPESLAEAIVDLFQHPEKSQSLVSNAKKCYQEYNWEKQGANLVQGYRELLA